MQQLNIDPHDAEGMDDLEEECERYQILVHIFHCVVMLVILVKYDVILIFENESCGIVQVLYWCVFSNSNPPSESEELEDVDLDAYLSRV